MLVVEYDNESYYEASFNDLYDILKNDESESTAVIDAMESLNNPVSYTHLTLPTSRSV